MVSGVANSQQAISLLLHTSSSISLCNAQTALLLFLSHLSTILLNIVVASTAGWIMWLAVLWATSFVHAMSWSWSLDDFTYNIHCHQDSPGIL